VKHNLKEFIGSSTLSIQSCGFSMPYFTYVGEQMKLSRVASQREARDKTIEAVSDNPTAVKAVKGQKRYWELKNTESLDGLPGLEKALNTSFRLTGYGANNVIKYAKPAHLQQIARKVGPDVFDLGDRRLFSMMRLLISFVIGCLLTSMCHKFLA
jgi:hypothetical protein